MSQQKLKLKGNRLRPPRLKVHPVIDRSPDRRVRTGGKKCQSCCENCRSIARLKSLTIDHERHVLCAKCNSLRRKQLKLKIKHQWNPVWLYKEGTTKRHRCAHGSSSFVVVSDGGTWTTLVCVFGYVHTVLTGFILDRPEED